MYCKNTAARRCRLLATGNTASRGVTLSHVEPRGARRTALILQVLETKKPPRGGYLKSNGADTENRTRDLTLTKGALYQLSHISTCVCGF